MTQRKPNDGGDLRPEQLAAYGDGELDPATRARAEAWLLDHPEAAAELEEQRRLARLWQAGAPPEPAEADWDGVLTRILWKMPRAATEVAALKHRRLWLATASMAMAAAVLLALLVFLPRGAERTPEAEKASRLREAELAPEPDAVEPFAVASASDVEIISMEDADTGTLVVGEPLVRGPIVLAGPGDVTLESVDPSPDGMVPSVRMADDHPMIIAPLDVAAEPENGK